MLTTAQETVSGTDGDLGPSHKRLRMLSKAYVLLDQFKLLRRELPNSLLFDRCETCKLKKSRCDSSRPQCENCGRKGESSVLFS
jgi:hypothetical protein